MFVKNIFYSVGDFVSKYIYTDTVTRVLRGAFVMSGARALANKSLGMYYRDKVTIPVNGEDVYFGTPNFEEFMIIRGLKDDKAALEEIIQELDEDDTFYDVGANIGLYSCSIAKLAGCDVYSFEPHPENSVTLAENAERNDVELNIVKKAVSDQEGTEKINIEKNVSGEGQANLTEDGDGEDIESCRLDNLIEQENAPVPDKMKIDVEGAEIKVIRGMENLEKDELPETIYCEMHPTVQRYGATMEELEEEIKEMGYTLEVMERMPGRRKMVKAELE